MREPLRQPFIVHSYEVDPGERLTPRNLCAFLQEAAGRDAIAFDVSVARLVGMGLAWVLQRLKVDVQAEPKLGASLTVTTWARHFGRVVAERDFQVWDEGGRLVAAATSRWVVVDLAARRVVRLPDFIRRLPVHPTRALELEGGELPAPAPAQIERRFEVRRSDLDAARHVNNTRYVGWALETVPDGVLDTHRPAAFEIVFHRESAFGEKIVSRSRELPPDDARAFAHGLSTQGNKSELARAVSRWTLR